jgi:hypothetical protein
MEGINPRFKTMLWASLMSDNEIFIANFLAKKQWSYLSFAEILRRFYATSVFHV